MARVRIEVDDAVIDAVFTEKDDFRLAVRGMTLMEAVLEEAIGDTFADGMPAPSARRRPDRGRGLAARRAVGLLQVEAKRP